MAKKTKDSNLSIEERLEQALISDGEKPYKLHDNWCWVKLSTVCSLENGEKSTEKDLVYLDAKTLRGITEPQTRDSGIIVEKDQKVILVDGENSGEVFVVPYRGYMGSTFKIINIAGNTDEMYIRYFIDYNREKLRNSKVGSAIPHLNKELFFNLELPLSPLDEQKRIVARIESFFSKLDEAKEKAQAVVDGFEIHKAAILHRAFSGELTANWRLEHGHGIETWKETTVGNVCHDVKVGIVIKPSQYYTDKESGTPAFRSANVRENRIDDFDWVYLNQTGMENNTRSIVHTGDVLVVRSGNPGTACVVTDKFDGYNAIDILIAVPDHNQVTSEFLCCYTNSPFGKDLVSKSKRGIALAHFSVKGYTDLPIRIPLLAEQNEIVHILDSLFIKELHAKEAAEAAIEQIEAMKKTILDRAFRGELGTTDPTEENATELIKQILEEKIKKEESKHKRTPKKRVRVNFLRKTILEALNSSQKLTPEKLKAETALEIDDFYDQLKALIDNGQIREIRIDGESYLEAVQ